MNNQDPHAMQQEIAQLEATLDAMPVSQREIAMERLREAMEASGEQLSAEDDDVFNQFAQGTLDIRRVEDHFGDRMWRAFGIKPDSK